MKYMVRVITDGGITMLVHHPKFPERELTAVKSQAWMPESLKAAIECRDAMRQEYKAAWIVFVDRRPKRGLNYDDLGRHPNHQRS